MKFLKYLTVLLILTLSACSGSSQTSDSVVTRGRVEKTVFTHINIVTVVENAQRHIEIQDVLACEPAFAEVVSYNDSIFDVTINNKTKRFIAVDKRFKGAYLVETDSAGGKAVLHGVPVSADTKLFAIQYANLVIKLSFGEINCDEL